MRRDEIVTLQVIAKNLQKYCRLAKNCNGRPFHGGPHGCRICWPCRWQLKRICGNKQEGKDVR